MKSQNCDYSIKNENFVKKSQNLENSKKKVYEIVIILINL